MTERANEVHISQATASIQTNERLVAEINVSQVGGQTDNTSVNAH